MTDRYTHLRSVLTGVDYRIIGHKPDASGAFVCETPEGIYRLIHQDDPGYEKVRPHLEPPAELFFTVEYADEQKFYSLGNGPSMYGIRYGPGKEPYGGFLNHRYIWTGIVEGPPAPEEAT